MDPALKISLLWDTLCCWEQLTEGKEGAVVCLPKKGAAPSAPLTSTVLSTITSFLELGVKTTLGLLRGKKLRFKKIALVVI